MALTGTIACLENKMERSEKIILTSLVGIAANLVLVVFKVLVGLASNSIAIILDAVNNLSDALSSVITIVGTKLARRPADIGHPYGHGRIEHLSALIITAIVLFAGVMSLLEAIKKIINPEVPDYTYATLVILAVAVIVKFFLGRYVSHVGKKVKSDALTASGADASFDSLISLATLVSVIVFMLSGLSVDAYLAALISLVIIKAGVEMAISPIRQLLGAKADSKFSQSIKEDVESVEGVLGAYDLLLHEYGPQTYVGSVHIEVKDTLCACEIDKISRRIQKKIFEDYGIFITVGIYSVNTSNPEISAIKREIDALVCADCEVMHYHGLSVDLDEREIKFDILIDISIPDVAPVYNRILSQMSSMHPGYKIIINIDRNITD